MGFRASSYSGGRLTSQSPWVFRALGAAGLALALGGCSAIGMPLGEPATGRVAPINGGSVLTASVTDKVDSSDWEAVRRLVASTSVETTSDALDWSNPDTGSTGTVATVAATDRDGRLCRGFATTVNDMRGVRRYRGEACKRTDGRWQLYGVTADDSVLS